ncbi:MAG: RluA family pseudouridine synthase [SAR86 cluster bacterium]|uniref:RluA family pseudouridine synthase n=1 Tax=SAR86 cluster bacterium TaxID=2030880 RepID=A0A973AA16_9GAMM|nr:RluA family pseudouridine synthase [SAR86 cluster bacterium]
MNYTFHQPPPCHDPLPIIYADDDILVVDKPAGLLSVPGRIMKDCVLSRVLQAFPQARIVHRLDLDTSGVMVLGLSQLAVSDLNRQFRERLVVKSYAAEVFGILDQAQGEISWPIAPDPVNRPRQKIDPEHGKHAITEYRLILQGPESARLALFPLTGRSHQLRLHLAHLGHPILGCDLYAHETAFQAASRLMLHAEKLGFSHPRTVRPVTFSSPVPFPHEASRD